MKNKRYYWQPELSLAIIYWSITFIFLFYGLIITLENTGLFMRGNVVIGIFLILLAAGLHRFFTFGEREIRIHYSLFWHKKKMIVASIQEIRSRKDGVLIKMKSSEKQHRFAMSKKQKSLFLNELRRRFPELSIKEENVKISHD
ncbi:hypothetical protein NRIC_15680 [Enterococcus florum]|uniref:EbsA protein n=1 Tax=Enterococcus florum TaxID=2480627 RepID=A0A4P5P6W5_9ENTE|nr:EbsA family protein [Enterococcus florum]GCF93677.1 hypothetical protein NRIC_15680 [Enterococcus florum]